MVPLWSGSTHPPTHPPAVKPYLQIGSVRLFTTQLHRVFRHRPGLSIDTMSSPSNSCAMEMHSLSHPQFFNCYQLQFPEQEARSVTSLSLIIDLNSTLSFQHPLLARALPGGVYEQSAGVRITVHERNLRPNIEVLHM